MSKSKNKNQVDDDADVDDQEEADVESGAVTQSKVKGDIMKNPEVLAALQDHLGEMIGPSPAEYVKSLPKVVRRRIKALKRLQAEAIKVESKFYEEVHQLECKYAQRYAPLLERRREIINALVEPSDAECEWESDEDDEELSEEMKEKAKIEDGAVKMITATDEPVKGVPGFWLTIFKNVDMLADMVQEHDEPILKHLQDIKVIYTQTSGFRLEFIFESNEFFTNAILTKEYSIRFQVEDDDPLNYEGPEIIKCKGCPIDWNKGKNVTVKLIKKVQKHKGRGTKRTVTKTVQNDSFFNFFNPPEVPEGEEADEDAEALLAADFEIGHFIRERIIPRAVLYFTGEALDPDDDYDEEEGDEEHDDEEEDDEEEDERETKPVHHKGHGHGHAPHAVAGTKQEECKQQ